MSDLSQRRGFTIVELLIVIVVIAILAAITIVAYNGIRQRTIEASIQSDLRNAASTAMNDNTINGSYPANAAAAGGGEGLKSSGTNIMTYDRRPYGFCILATNPGISTSFRIKSNGGKVESGNCDAVATTFAGSTSGYTNATGTSAQFATPADVAVDSAGNYYVADVSNNRIRMITSSGAVSLFAGSGASGNANGAVAVASFQNMGGITVDPQGNIYVMSGVGCIRKITAGVVSTLNGSCTYGWNDGAVATAQFRNPAGTTTDSAGNLYIADNGNHRIRMISTTGVVSTIAGSGVAGFNNATGTAAQFSNPTDVAIDSAGNLYVVDIGNNLIRKITPGGVVSTFAGSTAGYLDGTGTAAQFSSLYSMTIDSAGNLYVSEGFGSQRIRRITPTQVVTTIAGSGTIGTTDATGTAAQFNYPDGMIIDTSGRLIIADSGNHRIRILTL